MNRPLIVSKVHENRILGSFPQKIRDQIAPYLKPVKLKLGATVCEAGGRLIHAYFPQGCVLSLLTVMENGKEIECANIGREGAFGLFAAMYSQSSFNRCSVQLEGQMVRCEIEPLRQLFLKNEFMQELFIGYSETLLAQIMQTVACNSLHSVSQRMSRWLLMMHDRAEGEDLMYTHEFLAHIMGVNRTSVSQAASALQEKGLIIYRRGSIQIADRAGLEAVSCECYAIVNKQFETYVGKLSDSVQKTGYTDG